MTWYLVLQLLFWFACLGVLHTYVLYPILICVIARRKPLIISEMHARDATSLPFVSVLMSAYNEERVLATKLANLEQIDYPKDKLRFYLGSDASSDTTNALLRDFQNRYPQQAQIYCFEQRRGKPPVINDLAASALAHTASAPNHILLLTDASVMLTPETVYQLARHYRDPRIGCADAHMLAGAQDAGIAPSESVYMQLETRVKQCESRAWRMMIGPFGGCYTLRSDLFRPVPPRSLVDDFYLGFGALEAGYGAINDLQARCYEQPTQRLSDEYRRKKRIATGSMKNLGIYARHVLPPVTRLGFAFFSHKVLRWFTPWLLLVMLVCTGLLASQSAFYALAFTCAIIGIFGISALYGLSQLLGINVPGIKHLFYFLAMNVALMHGTITWAQGIKSDIWQPTRRE